jgi:hypothetical protein
LGTATKTFCTALDIEVGCAGSQQNPININLLRVSNEGRMPFIAAGKTSAKPRNAPPSEPQHLTTPANSQNIAIHCAENTFAPFAKLMQCYVHKEKLRRARVAPVDADFP